MKNCGGSLVTHALQYTSLLALGNLPSVLCIYLDVSSGVHSHNTFGQYVLLLVLQLYINLVCRFIGYKFLYLFETKTGDLSYHLKRETIL
jgi:small neutral amino acid transporter SnatA (MarC family)